VSSKIDTFERNRCEPLAILLASIVARLSTQDFAHWQTRAYHTTTGDIVRDAELAVAGVAPGVVRGRHRARPIADLRRLISAGVIARVPVLRDICARAAAAVLSLRTGPAVAFHGARQALVSAPRFQLTSIAVNRGVKIAGGLAVAVLAVSLALVQLSGRLGRPLPQSEPSEMQASPAAQAAEERPSGVGGIEFTRSNMRYCTFQQIRLEALGPITEGADLGVFNALVEDWNARCTKYRYRPEDKDAVDAEAGRRRALLEVEGRALMNGWRRKIVTTVQQRPVFAAVNAGESAVPMPADA